MLLVLATVMATCLEQLNNMACANNVTCFTCADRIAFLEDVQNMKRANAEAQIAQEFPTECGACTGRVVTPVLTQECDAVVTVQACSNGECHSCGSRIQYLYTVQQYSINGAVLQIAREFPTECGACLPPDVTPPHSSYPVKNPVRFERFMRINLATSGNMPLSYRVEPATYFNEVPTHMKTLTYTQSETVAECSASATKGVATADQLNEYTFQTERYLTTLGLDVYDGAVWSMAMSVLTNEQLVRKYTRSVLETSTTAGLQSIRSDLACKGKDCDPFKESCGVCYGDDYTTLSKDNALMIRLIGDHFAAPGSSDARCPDISKAWQWNDFKPILGENAWSLLLGPLATAIQRYGSAAAIPETSKDFLLALNIIPALEALKVNVSEGSDGYGAYYYTANNIFTYAGSNNLNAGSTVSIENQASLYAGLKGLEYVLSEMKCTNLDCRAIRCDVGVHVNAVESLLLSAYNGQYFRTDGAYNATTRVWTWHEDSPFAADCQTWVGTVLGPAKIDARYGTNTTRNLWQTIKDKAGYGRFQNGTVRGVGYDDIKDPVYYANSTTVASPTFKISLSILSSLFDPTTYMPLLDSFLSNNSMGVKAEVVSHQRETNGFESVSVAFVAQEGVDYTTVRDVCFALVYDLNTPGNAIRDTLSVSRVSYTEVFSAEWTLGAVNFARLIAAESSYPTNEVEDILWDADFMRRSLEEEQLFSFTHLGLATEAFTYANARYYVPFGWWANNIPSTASTGWGVMVDMGWNPLHVLGTMSSSYPKPAQFCDTPAPATTASPPEFSSKYVALSIGSAPLDKVVGAVSEMQASVVKLLSATTNECVQICAMKFISNVWFSQQCYSCDGTAQNRHSETLAVPERHDVLFTMTTQHSYADAAHVLTQNGPSIIHPTRGAFDGVAVTASTPAPKNTPSPDTPSPAQQPTTVAPPVSPGTPSSAQKLLPHTFLAAFCIILLVIY
eukprot:TRINITY_DN2882_c0_g1_i1.p1 TRINITY_DN2882_c0_g1~~TRINITY_DN2882_c0_g1_i1.p1  ORF type:complete len:960 (+),score=138.30 TRINITY_DN2882_c0_g1_i1:767-3646(+)